MPGMLQVAEVIARAFGTCETKCKTCGKTETFKLLGEDGSHSYKCGCGCRLYKFHPPDKFNRHEVFLKIFIPKSKFDKNYKNKDAMEKLGFKKENKNKKVVYSK